jgi:hypothetical protein
MTIDQILEVEHSGVTCDTGPMHGTLHQLAAEVRRLRERERVLVEWLGHIAKTEQAHCYVDINDSEIIDNIKTRHDLRKCGNCARAALEAVKE